jgi:pyruvate dehydrogenase E1 component alpha subunit
MALQFPEYRVYGSAIAGGIIPIALGVAMAIKQRGGDDRVWLFIGDMMAQSGIFHESVKYAENFGLPLSVVIEDNGFSVCTDTLGAWGLDRLTAYNYPPIRFIRYRYRSKYPHAGAGKRVQF